MKTGLLSLLVIFGFAAQSQAAVECTGKDENSSYVLNAVVGKGGEKGFVLAGTNNETQQLMEMEMTVESSVKNKIGGTVYKGAIAVNIDDEVIEMGTYKLILPKIAGNTAQLTVTFDEDRGGEVEELTLTCKNVMNAKKSAN